MDPRTARRRAGALLIVLGLLLPLLALFALEVEAAPRVPFDVRFQTDDNGAIGLYGNNLMTCPAADTRCAGARAGTNNINNNDFAMRMLDADANAATFNSSSAQVQLPDSSSVLWAGLYWGARLAAGPGGTVASTPSTRMKLRVPGGDYQAVTSQSSFGPTAGDRAYQEFADVTALVRGAGPGTYWGADVAAGTGEDRYAGWSLVVVYRDPTLPLRNLTVFDGFDDVGRDNPQSIPISGFRTPVQGAVETQVGLVAYEGDRGSSGDQARLDGTQLSTPISTGSNFFNSANDDNGSSVTARDPADRSMIGYDIKRLGTSGIANNATSATVSLSSTGDRYFPGVVTTAIGLYAPDFSTSSKTVTNLSGRDPAEPGDVLEYALTFANTGQDPATGSVTTDPIPAGTTYLPGSLTVTDGPNQGVKTDAGEDDQAEYLSGLDAVRFRLGSGAGPAAGGTIGVGATTRATFRVTVTPEASGTTVSNTAPLDYTAATLARPFTYAVAPATIRVREVADLSITKATTPDPAAAGAVLTSRLSVRNAGPSRALGVQVRDQLPAGVDFVDASTPQGSCEESAGQVGCDLGTVASGTTVVVTVRFRVPAASQVESVVNTATVSSPTSDPDAGNNTSGSSAAIVQSADLALTKSVDDPQLRPGQETTVRLRVTNNGASDARGVMISDQVVDPGVTLLAADLDGATCSVVDISARCTLPELASGDSGDSATMTIRVAVAADLAGGVTLGDTANVSARTPDPEPANNTDQASITTLAPQADLRVSKDATPVSYAGGIVQYDVTVTNDGPSSARAVTFEDVLPAGLTATTVSATRGTCSGTTSVSCDLGDIGPTATAVVTVVAAIPADQEPGDLVNTASVDSPTADPTPGDRQASATTNVRPRSDVAVTKTADNYSPSAGESVTYTVTVSNNGPSTARGVTLTDDLPDEFDLVSVDAPAGVTCVDGDPVTCTVGELAVGEQRVVTVTVQIPADLDLEGDYPNVTVVDAAGEDPVPDNNRAVATVTTALVSDLITIKRVSDPADDAPFVAGREVTYQMGVGNFGPADASSARLTDVLPPGVTFVSSVPECVYQPGDRTVVCDLPDVPSQFAAVFPITVRLDADLPEGTLLTNTAEVELTDPDRIDPVSSNNAASVTRPVTTSADIALDKSSASLDLPDQTFVEPAATPPGGIVSFGIDLRNTGPSVARGVVITDTVDLSAFGLGQVRLVRPDGSIEDLTASCSVGGRELQCPIGDLPVFAAGDTSWRLQIDGVILSSEPPGEYVNTATASSSTTELTTADNTDDAPITVLPPVATLTVDKTSPADSLVAGGTFSYVLSVNNILDLQREGASDAPDVVLDDVLPAGLTATSVSTSQGSCTTDGASVRCELGTVLGPGRLSEVPPVLVRVSGTVDPTATGTLTNSVDVTSPISEPVSDELALPVRTESDLSVVKQADSPTTPAGGTVGYSVIVTNAGPSAATDVQLSDVLPARLTVDPSLTDPGCLPVAEPLACSVGSLAVGESRTRRVVGTLAPDATEGPLTNTATLAERADDPDPTDNTSTVTTQVTRESNVSITKTASTQTVPVGSAVTWTLTAANSGPSDATDVAIVDTLPAGVTVTSVSPDASVTCDPPGGGEVRCTAARLSAGASAVVTIETLIQSDREPGDLTNEATVSLPSGITDPDASDNAASATVTAYILADTRVVKTLLTDNPVAGQPLTFALDVVNLGPQDAPAVVLSDGLPQSLAFLSARVVDGSDCGVTNPEGTEIVTCPVGTLAVGQTARAIVTARAADVESLTNVVSVGSTALDPAALDNVDTLAVRLAPAPTPTPTPTPSPSPTSSPSPGEPSTSPTTGPTASPTPGAGSDPAASPGGPLPDTGAPDLLPWLLAGLALVLSGLTLVWRNRRFRS